MMEPITTAAGSNHIVVDFNDTCHASEDILIRLEQIPEDPELLYQLYQHFHDLKQLLQHARYNHVVPLAKGLEDLLQAVHSGRVSYDNMLGDLILLTLDTARTLLCTTEDKRTRGIAREHIELLSRAITSICLSEDPKQREKAIFEAILALDPSAAPDSTFKGPEFWRDTRPADDDFNRMLEENWEVSYNQDLNFLSHLHAPIEERAPYWRGRSRRLAILTLLMNKTAGKPVDPTQLLAAVYTHDIGMAFLPLELLTSESSFNQEELELMQRHVDTGYDLLKRMGNWDTAAEIVLQHHENFDGSGYPSGLEENSINPGAKILAIAGTFDACVHGRPHKVLQQRPVQRAILEVNHHSDTQFDPHWVDIFNQVAKHHLIS